MMAFDELCNERNLSKQVVLEAIEMALISAYKRDFGSAQNVQAKIDPETGESTIYIEKQVVEKVQDDRFEISLEEARAIKPDAAIGDTVCIESTPRNFGRIAAQTAKQVIMQRIREAEREALFNSYADREGELVNGTVQSITPAGITINLGRTEALLPRSQTIPGERYRIGQRLRAYVLEVRRSNRGPQIILSRSHRRMLRRLLELEVPEIFNGVVEIKAIAREPGSRSKIAVAARQEGVDPVGSCVGMRGVRIQSIVNELSGEKIDVVEWHPDTATFIANALSPAKVAFVRLGDGADRRTATVVVPDDQLSLAIGKEGQNARLAAKLTGWRIDIKSLSEAEAEGIRPQEPGEVAAKEKEEKDLLALAEAILLEKAPPSTLEEVAQVQAPSEEEESPVEAAEKIMEAVAEEAPPAPPEEVAAPEAAPPAEEEVAAPVPEGEEVAAVEEPEELPLEKLFEEEEEELIPDIIDLEALAEEEEEEELFPKKKKKKKKGRGRRERKPSRRRSIWDEIEEFMD